MKTPGKLFGYKRLLACEKSCGSGKRSFVALDRRRNNIRQMLFKTVDMESIISDDISEYSPRRRAAASPASP